MRSRLRGHSILVGVLDEPLREALARTLAREGATVTTCSTGADVLSSVAPQTPDLCLLDVDLRGPSGESIATLVRGVAPSLPIVLVSAHLFESEDARPSGFPILPLPFRRPQLLDVLGELLPAD